MNSTPSPRNKIPPSILDCALEYQQRGWAVIPIAAGAKKPPKKFQWRQFQKRQPTEHEIREWFADRDDLGIAVILGKVSGGLVCRDFDSKESYTRWKRSHRDLALRLPTVKTKRGFHVYFRAAPENLVFQDFRPVEDGEYRGDSAHYCLLPPSSHPDGVGYEWAVILSEDDLPFIGDVMAAGLFLGSDVTQNAQGSHKNAQVMSWGLQGGDGTATAARVSSSAPRPPARKLTSGERAIVEEAIMRTLPTKPGERRKRLFELARRLKFTAELAGTPATEIDCMKPYLQHWWKLAKPHTSGGHPHFHESWHDFKFAWEEARTPFGAAMQAIFEKACSRQAPQMAIEKYGEGSLKALLASLCRELQLCCNGSDRLYLASRTVGHLLGVSSTHAWRFLNTLEKDKIIEVVESHPRASRLATEYRYLGD